MTDDDFKDDLTASYAGLAPGSRISHYEVVSKIGAGGMGEVYLAEDKSLNRQVALKFLPLEYSQSGDSRKRFQREAQASAALNHPRIVTIFEVSEYKERPFLAMEYVEGQPLDEFIRSRDCPIENIITMSVQIAEGIQEAHSKNIVHRDIKPTNILIDKCCRPKILDFGLASYSGMEQITKTGHAVGTIGYMSPELLQSEKGDELSDIFSFGVVLHEMLTGHNPFRKENAAATINAILSKAPERLAAYRNDIPDAVQRIIDKALEKRRDQRYQTMEGLLSDLKAVKTSLDAGKEIPVTFKSRLSAARRIVPFRWIAIIISAMILIILLVPSTRNRLFQWVHLASPSIAKHLVVLPLSDLTGTNDNRIFCDGMMETVTGKLTQLEKFKGSLWVVPAREVRDREVTTPSQARKTFGATLAITGSVQRASDQIRMILNLVDTKTNRQLNSLEITNKLVDVLAFQDSTVIKLAEILELQLLPEVNQYLAAGGTTDPEAFKHYLQGQGYLQNYREKGNIDSSIILFQRALEHDRDYALAYVGLGQAYWKKYLLSKESEWIDDAIEHCRKAIKLNDNLAVAYIAIGEVLNGAGQYQEATEQLEKALAIDPVNSSAYRELASVYEALNQYDMAEETYIKAIGLKPDYWAGHDDLANFYIKTGRYDEAFVQLHRVAELLPEGYITYNALGALYFYLGQRDSARTLWERSIEIEPNYAAYSNLATVYYFEKKYQRAAETYEKALALDDTDYKVYINLASAYYWSETGQDSAIATYKHAIKLAEKQRKVNPHDPEVLSNLAVIYAVTGDTTRALACISQAITAAPENVYIMVQTANVYEELGDRKTALKWVSRALENGCTVEEIEELPEFGELIKDPQYKDLF